MDKCIKCKVDFIFDDETCAIDQQDNKVCSDCYQKHYGYCDNGCNGLLEYKNAMLENERGEHLGVLCSKCRKRGIR